MDKKNFGNISIINQAFQRCYLKKESTPGWSKFRVFLSKSAHFFFKIIYRSDLDSTNAFRLYNLKLIDPDFINKIKFNDYEFFFTSLVILKNKKYKIIQIPMKILGRSHGNSKMLLKHVFKSILTMFLFYFGLRESLFLFVAKLIIYTCICDLRVCAFCETLFDS